MRIISIVGHKDAGKTTLLVALARDFNRRGKKVGSIARGTDRAEAKGSDGARHFQEGLTDALTVSGDETVVLHTRGATDPESLARRYFEGYDVVLVEGFVDSALPKIEIHRSATGPEPLIRSAPVPSQWIAVVTDSDVGKLPCPALRFTDTMWLQLLLSIAWDHAKVVSA